MIEIDAELQAQVDLMTQQYARRLPEKIARIEETWLALQHSWDGETRDILLRQIHNLTGSGATFGFSTLSVRAREAEQFLKGLGYGAAGPEHAQLERFVALLAGIKRAIAEPDGGSSPAGETAQEQEPS